MRLPSAGLWSYNHMYQSREKDVVSELPLTRVTVCKTIDVLMKLYR